MTPRLRFRVTPAAEKVLHAGHPWIFDDSIREQNRPGTPGELGIVYDRHDRFLAAGWYDPGSPIRLRILQHARPASIDPDWWKARIGAALERRAAYHVDSTTTGYRLIHGESDGIPGLVADRYHDTLVVKIYSHIWRPHLRSILPMLTDQLKQRGIQIETLVYRTSRNAADAIPGWESGNAWLAAELARTERSISDPRPLESKAAIFLEHGLRFRADVVQGQKTGFFLDQRENRKSISEIAAGCRVLNAFSFSGGFSVHAAAGGATAVTDMDISAHALESGRFNLQLNSERAGVRSCHHETIQADVFEWLSKTSGREFEIVIVDPPALAKRKTEVGGAIESYRHLAASASRFVRDGGHLLVASCSAHVTAGDFHEAVRGTLRRTDSDWRICWQREHPTDHAATFAEARYLKAALWQKNPARVHPSARRHSP